MKNVKIASALAISAFALFAFIPEKLSLNLHKFGGKFNNLTVVADTASKNFATNAAAANMMEIETGNLALKKASNQRVKAFAQMMVKDHTMTDIMMSQFLLMVQSQWLIYILIIFSIHMFSTSPLRA